MKITEKENLSLHCTMRTGGPASFFARFTSLSDLDDARKFVTDMNLPFKVIGQGSNILVSDEGFRGLILKNEISGIRILPKRQGKRQTSKSEGGFEDDSQSSLDEVLVTVGAGENFDNLIDFLLKKNLYDLENLSGIPGTVGASPIQNIGAYGSEINEYVHTVDIYDMKTGKVQIFSNTDCQFSYRDSFFKRLENSHLIVISVTFILKKWQGGEGCKSPVAPGLNYHANIGYKDLAQYFSGKYSKDISPHEVRQAVLEIRAKKLPDWHLVGTVGSFFKNPIVSAGFFEKLRLKYPDMPGFSYVDPNQDHGHGHSVANGDLVKIPLAWILDKVCGLNGWKNQAGSVGFYPSQPLAIVNYINNYNTDSKTADIEAVAKMCADLVYEKTGIVIESEVVRV